MFRRYVHLPFVFSLVRLCALQKKWCHGPACCRRSSWWNARLHRAREVGHTVQGGVTKVRVTGAMPPLLRSSKQSLHKCPTQILPGMLVGIPHYVKRPGSPMPNFPTPAIFYPARSFPRCCKSVATAFVVAACLWYVGTQHGHTGGVVVHAAVCQLVCAPHLLRLRPLPQYLPQLSPSHL